MAVRTPGARTAEPAKCARREVTTMARPRTIKVTIEVVTVTEREVELAVHCPKCNADLTEEDAIRGDGWMGVSQTAHLDGERLAWDDEIADHFECQYTDSLHCNDCGELLADGTDGAPEPDSYQAEHEAGDCTCDGPDGPCPYRASRSHQKGRHCT